LATGAALAAHYQGRDDVAICFFGDGASNQGTTHEAMNLATCMEIAGRFCQPRTIWRAFPHARSTPCVVADIADRAAAYDMPGVVVDGNDVIAVYEAAFEAVKRAREGQGPSLIECKTYRQRGHFEGDPCVYRNEDELAEWKAKDPLARFENKLMEAGLMDADKVQEFKNATADELAEAVKFAEESPFPELSEVTDDVYTL